MYGRAFYEQELIDLRERLNQFAGRFYDLSEDEKKEIERIQARIDELQKTCGHYFEEFTLFYKNYRACKYCGKPG